MTLKISQPTMRLAAAAVADLMRRCAIKVSRLLTGPAEMAPPQTPEPNA
jgi:hypothetical protein